ncbi:Uncharacterized protein HZ326_19830 [Fusarium oxysporum f. sp. albedinis]|nr:Uncharacterized protein HZ326_19830 [Fusarium oxysporum f. sp. albedinis]
MGKNIKCKPQLKCPSARHNARHLWSCRGKPCHPERYRLSLRLCTCQGPRKDVRGHAGNITELGAIMKPSGCR